MSHRKHLVWSPHNFEIVLVVPDTKEVSPIVTVWGGSVAGIPMAKQMLAYMTRADMVALRDAVDEAIAEMTRLEPGE